MKHFPRLPKKPDVIYISKQINFGLQLTFQLYKKNPRKNTGKTNCLPITNNYWVGALEKCTFSKMKLFSGLFENPKVFELEISLRVLEKDATKNSYLYNNLFMTRVLSKTIRSRSKLKDAYSKYEIEENFFIKLLRKIKFRCFQNLTWK